MAIAIPSTSIRDRSERPTVETMAGVLRTLSVPGYLWRAAIGSAPQVGAFPIPGGVMGRRDALVAR